MGAWGAGPFENDDASDWVYEIEPSEDAATVRAALAVGDVDYIEVDEGSIAVSAAEVVAASIGRPRSDLPEEIVAWVARNGSHLRPVDASAAISAVERVLGEDSEIKELWDDAGDDSWERSVRELLGRLSGSQ